MAANIKSSPSAGCPRRKSDLFKILWLILPLCAPLRAQQEPTVSMQIDVVAWGDTISGLSLKSGGKQGEITALGFRYSTPIAYSGPAILEIHKSASGDAAAPRDSDEDKSHELSPLAPTEPGAGSGTQGQAKQGIALELEKRRVKEPTLVALAALPGAGCRRATVLLAPADAGTFTAYVIDDDPSQLPPGQLRVHNLTPLTVALRCNGQLNKELKARETFLVPGQNGQLIYELAYKLGDEWKVQENNIIPVRPTEQAQMMILKSSNNYFLSSDGSGSGFLQIVTLRRGPASPKAP